MKPVYLVIASRGVGGAEKRLAEIWLELSRRGLPMRMIVPADTFDQLLDRPDLAGLAAYRDQVIPFMPRGQSFVGMMRDVAAAIRSVPRGSTFHHILAAPPLIHRWRGDRMILSWVTTFFPVPQWSRSGMNNWLGSRWAVAEADRLDVLNPDVAARLSRNPSLRRKISITAGGTFVDFDHFRPAPTKRREVVFLGRIEASKNALAFAEAIPDISRRVAAAGLVASFRLYGSHGDQFDAVAAMIASPAYRDIDVVLAGTTDPAAALAPAKVFASIQSPSNYPSKALAEAMACGCLCVITDGGESRLMADDKLARFIPGAFTNDQLAEAIAALLLLDDGEAERLAMATRADAMARFSLATQADYFEALYAEAEASGGNSS